MARRPTETVQLKVRLPHKLHGQIRSAAARENRSVNWEIWARLERSFQKEDDATTAVAKALIDGLDDGITEKIFQIISMQRFAEKYEPEPPTDDDGSEK
jgi:hypothetical protein